MESKLPTIRPKSDAINATNITRKNPPRSAHTGKSVSSATYFREQAEKSSVRSVSPLLSTPCVGPSLIETKAPNDLPKGLHLLSRDELLDSIRSNIHKTRHSAQKKASFNEIINNFRTLPLKDLFEFMDIMGFTTKPFDIVVQRRLFHELDIATAKQKLVEIDQRRATHSQAMMAINVDKTKLDVILETLKELSQELLTLLQSEINTDHIDSLKNIASTQRLIHQKFDHCNARQIALDTESQQFATETATAMLQLVTAETALADLNKQ